MPSVPRSDPRPNRTRRHRKRLTLQPRIIQLSPPVAHLLGMAERVRGMIDQVEALDHDPGEKWGDMDLEDIGSKLSHAYTLILGRAGEAHLYDPLPAASLETSAESSGREGKEASRHGRIN